MDQLKKNPFWVGVGVLVLVAIGLYVYLIQGQMADEFRTKNGQLTSSVQALKGFASRAVEEFPVQKRLEAYENEAKAIEAERKALIEYYEGLDAAGLEKIFPALEGKLGVGGLPKTSDFNVEHQREFDALKAEFAALIDEEKPPFIYTNVEKPDEIKTIQKRFWIQQRFARACQAAGVMRIEEIAFPGDKKGDGWGTVLQVRTSVRIAFPDVARLVSELLRSDIAWKVRELEVTKLPIALGRPDGVSRVEPEARDQAFFSSDYVLFHFDDADKAEPFRRKPQDLIPEPPVRAILKLEVLDFEFPKEAEGGPEDGFDEENG